MDADAPEPAIRLRSVHLDANGAEVEFQSEVIPIIAQAIAAEFIAKGGRNYVTFEFSTERLGPLELTVQRRWGITPAAKATKLASALVAIDAIAASALKDGYVVAPESLRRIRELVMEASKL